MSKVQIRRVENLTDKETDDIVAMLIRAYVENPAIPPMTGGNKDLEDNLFRCMVRAGGLEGDLFVVEDKNHQILSMALWFAPGSGLFGTEEQRKLGLYDFMNKLDDTTREWWTTTYPQEVAAFIATWLPMSTKDTWYLNILGTDPAHQRKGYATLLLNDAVRNIQSPNTIAFCTTSELNGEFYSKAGFPIRGRMRMSAQGYTFLVLGHSREV